MAEWLKALDSKSSRQTKSVSRVQIPLSPPVKPIRTFIFIISKKVNVILGNLIVATENNNTQNNRRLGWTIKLLQGILA